MTMSPHFSAPQRLNRGWAIFNYTAMALAVIALIALIVVLISKWAGGLPWPGFNWIAMLALPAAFLMMGTSVLYAVAARRRS
ncbi:fatty acid desaturase [Arthrobacter sp. UYCu511]